MANMSYCRFHNTYIDLMDCKGQLESMLDESEQADCGQLSADEIEYARMLIQVCKDIRRLVKEGIRARELSSPDELLRALNAEIENAEKEIDDV